MYKHNSTLFELSGVVKIKGMQVFIFYLNAKPFFIFYLNADYYQSNVSNTFKPLNLSRGQRVR